MKDVGVRYSYALNDGKERVSIQNAKKGETYTCQLCGNKMIPKKGNIKRWHYAHTMDVGCDVWYRNKGEWHIEMQEKFDEDCREVVVTTEDGEKHIADVCIEKPCGQKLVIEFQNSPMTAEEFKERTNFWKNKVGADIIWVFNFKQDKPQKKNRFQEIPSGYILKKNAKDYYNYYRWRNPSIPFSQFKRKIPYYSSFEYYKNEPIFVESVPIIFYMNAEEKSEWRNYENYDTSSINGQFNINPFYLKLCGISPADIAFDIYDIYKIDLDGYDLIYGEKYGESWFKAFIEGKRCKEKITGKFNEFEYSIVEKKGFAYLYELFKVCDYQDTSNETLTRLKNAKKEYEDVKGQEKENSGFESTINRIYERLRMYFPYIYADIMNLGKAPESEIVQKQNQETTTTEKSVKAQETIRKSTEEESTEGQTKDHDPKARTIELIGMLKEKLAEYQNLPNVLEEEIRKDPIGTYKKYAEMIRSGRLRDERVISRLALLYRGKILTSMDSESMAEFFEVFAVQLQHEMPQYRAYCERSGEAQSRMGLMGFLARKYWNDEAAQTEAKRLMDNEIPDVVKVLLGLDMTSGLPFID